MTVSSSLQWVQANRQHPYPSRRRLHAIVSSRLGRYWLRFPQWLSAVKWVVQRMCPDCDALLTAPGMMTAPLVEYWARRSGISVVRLNTTCADEFVTLRADRVFALAVRAGGNIENCLRQRLQMGKGQTCWLLLNDQLTESHVAQRLIQSGAIGWSLPAPDQAPETKRGHETNLGRNVTAFVLPYSQQPAAGDMLFHWTREPMVTSADWRRGLNRQNDWWFRLPMPAQGPLATLWQIITERRLAASSQGNRSNCPVACLTQTPPNHWRELRKFQSHRGRWDFEPYGLALCRQKLMAWGCQPVIYGDHADWLGLTSQQQPFFQKSATPRQPGGLSWTQESEWRVLGDVNLSYFGTGELVVFVPTEGEALWLQGWSRWPVTFLIE